MSESIKRGKLYFTTTFGNLDPCGYLDGDYKNIPKGTIITVVDIPSMKMRGSYLCEYEGRHAFVSPSFLELMES